jgi:hypothetical protein
MRPIHVPSLTPLQGNELDHLYRTTNDPRLRTRAQMVLLSVEQGLKVPQIAAIVREREATVLRWRKRYLAEGVEGVQDAPRTGHGGLSERMAYRCAPTTAQFRAPVFPVDLAAFGR